MKTIGKLAISFMAALLLCFSADTALAQDQRLYLCKTWKLKKILVDGDKNKNRIVNDHLLFRKDMQYKSFDSADKIGKYATGGAWVMDKSGQYIVQNPGTPMEKRLRIKKLNENMFVFEMDMQKSVWEVHMRAEE